MASELHVELVSVEEKVFSGDVTLIQARTTEGELGILPHHTPLLGQLAEPGEVRLVFANGTDAVYTVDGGFIAVEESGVTILAETCVPAESETAR